MGGYVFMNESRVGSLLDITEDDSYNDMAKYSFLLLSLSLSLSLTLALVLRTLLYFFYISTYDISYKFPPQCNISTYYTHDGMDTHVRIFCAVE